MSDSAADSAGDDAHFELAEDYTLAGKGLVNERYQILAALGEGGMGTISLARDTELDRLVALKRLTASFPSPAKQARFEAEALASARLHHPNLVRTHELIWSPRDLCLVMEYVEGESLAERLEEEPLTREEILHVAKGVAAGLAHAHSQSVIHRDLKPDNVMLGDDGRVLLIDFGLAKRMDSSQALTRTGQFIGTPTYVPPEQIADGKNADARADIYGFGACLYHMLCGQPPFLCENLAQLVGTILVTPPEAPSRIRPGVDPGLARVAMRCLQKSPEDRYQTADELLEALSRVGEAQSKSSRGLWILLGLGVALGLGATAVAVSTPDLPSLPPPTQTLAPAATPGLPPAPEAGRLTLLPSRGFQIPGQRYGNLEYCALTSAPGGKVLVALRSNPYQLTRWDLATRRLEASWTVGIDRAAGSPGGDQIAVIGGSTLSFFPASLSKLAGPRKLAFAPEGWFPGWTSCALSFSRDGTEVALASQAGGILISDVASGRTIQRITCDRYFRDCAISDGLVFGAYDGGRRGQAGIRLWSLTSGRELGRLKTPGAGRIALLSGARVAFGGKSKHVMIVRMTSAGLKDLTFLDSHEGQPGSPRPLAHSLPVTCLAIADGSLYTGAGMVGIAARGELRRWNATTLELIETIKFPSAPLAIAPHPGGVLVLTHAGRVEVLKFSGP